MRGLRRAPQGVVERTPKGQGAAEQAPKLSGKRNAVRRVPGAGVAASAGRDRVTSSHPVAFFVTGRVCNVRTTTCTSARRVDGRRELSRGAEVLQGARLGAGRGRRGGRRHHLVRAGFARRHRLCEPARRRHRGDAPATPTASSSRSRRSPRSTRRSAARSSARNDELDADPSLVNSDPYGAGWLVRVRLADAARARRTHGRRRLPGSSSPRPRAGRRAERPCATFPTQSRTSREMLAAVGAGSVDELFAEIPEDGPLSRLSRPARRRSPRPRSLAELQRLAALDRPASAHGLVPRRAASTTATCRRSSTRSSGAPSS